MMNKQVRTLMGAAAAAAMVIGLGLSPAAAATATWTVTPGGNFYTKYEFVTPELTDATTGARFSCATGFVIHGTQRAEPGWPTPSARSPMRSARPAVTYCCAPGKAWYSR